jgi:hypothetical protein
LSQLSKIKIGKNKSHIIKKIQFLIQLAIARTIHQSQGLLLDKLAFDPTNVRKHGLSYTALSYIQNKRKIILVTSTSTSKLSH